MLESYLSSLTKRQSMLLLTAVTFGGQDSLASLDYLPQAEAALLRDRAQALLALPRERRIPMLVQEMKRLVTPRRGQLWSTGPEQLAQLMLRERRVLRQVLLKALPSGLADSVRRYIPQERTQPKREARSEVLNIVRGKLEEILARATPAGAAFKFSDILLLQPRELITLLDELGTRALAPAYAGLEESKREALFSRLPPGSHERVRAAVNAAASRRLLEEDAQEMLSLHSGPTPLDGIRSAGGQRLARALLAQSAEFALRVLERNPGDLGVLLARWLKEERVRAVNRGDGGRAEVVGNLEELASRGLVERPLRPANPTAILPDQPAKAGGALMRPPLLPAPRAQAALRMVAKGLDEKKAAPPPKRDAMAERAARRAGAAGRGRPGETEATEPPTRPHGETRSHRPRPGGLPGGRGPKGRSG